MLEEQFETELWELICNVFRCDQPFTSVQAANAAADAGLIKGKGPYTAGYHRVRKALMRLEKTTEDLEIVPKGSFKAWVLPSRPDDPDLGD